MNHNELLVFRTYDSAKHPFRSPLHTSFQDEAREALAGAEDARRTSVEVRILLVIPPEQQGDVARL
jgi:hypothetical protein